MTTARYMREDATVAKMTTAIGTGLRGMVRNTMQSYERKVPYAVGRGNFHAFMQAIDEAARVQEEARQRKQERLEKHFARLEAEEAQVATEAASAEPVTSTEPAPSGRKRKRARSPRDRAPVCE